MTLKIERISGKRRTRIRLSGAFRSEHLDQVKAESSLVDHEYLWIWKSCISWMSKAFAFSTRVRGGRDLSAALLALYQGVDVP